MIDWNAVFGMVNLLALIAWVLLIFLPRWPALLSGVMYMGVGLLCLIYAASLIGLVSGLIPNPEGGGADFSSIEGVQAIFATKAGTTIGWTHYLAFDLFVGLWIARDGDAKNISRLIQAPVLLATFLAGPLGLLVWLLVREPAARKQGRFR
ncbi:ABA4-like family protein [Erythrobacter dokdonensis]|uniref:Putative integral membrane protein n=1 Tax=Erythrobacter dokdonensis DSW-74 TaxID=1300349 RepID=A0A1A7BJ25_9SPHN|nr:ABA4-like family protein [Erythrobacter dokdonensis]OBV11452.1 putative integral membrane protein [Erythrobacter dokdonensis DSW-74]